MFSLRGNNPYEEDGKQKIEKWKEDGNGSKKEGKNKEIGKR